MARTATGLNGPHPVDRHVGLAIRARRRSLGVTQQGLAARLGITFQQVQKYERGRNRVSASMLHAMAVALETPVAAFFEGLPCETAAATSSDTARQEAGRSGGGGPPGGRARLVEMLAAPGGIDLADAWLALPSDKVRRRVSALMRAMGPYAGV